MTGARVAEIQAVLLAAFSAAEFGQVTRRALDVPVEAIATGNFSDQVFAVIDYAARHDSLNALLIEAAIANPGNEEVRRMVQASTKQVSAASSLPTPRLTTMDDRGTERLDQLINSVADLRGQVIALRQEFDSWRHAQQSFPQHLAWIVLGAILTTAAVWGLMFLR